MFRIEGQPEPCLGIVRGDEFESFRNRLIESVFGSCLGRAEQLFQLGDADGRCGTDEITPK
jgi:hypothetical protein